MLDIILIKIAQLILRERNVGRAGYTSRRDNNDMYYMSERLGNIIRKIQKGYNDEN